MSTLSIGKLSAIASTVFLMGVYVWYQAQSADPTVVADTTTGQAVAPTVSGSQPELLPGPKSAPVEFGGESDGTPWVDLSQLKVLPGSKSDSIVLLPGSKSGKVIVPQQVEEEGESKPKARKFFPGSKSKAPLISPSPKKEEKPVQAQRKILPGSKALTPLFSTPNKKHPEAEPTPAPPQPTPAPNANKKQSKVAPIDSAYLPGSKSGSIRILPPKPEQKTAPPPVPSSKQGKVLPGSKAPFAVLEVDPEVIKKRLAEQADKRRKALEARNRLQEQRQQKGTSPNQSE